MSSLWTPGGEVPVERDRPGAPPPTEAPAGGSPGPDPGGDAPTEEELEARAREVQRMLLELPAAEVVAQHVVGLYELAAVHLSQEQPRLDDAALAIDALRSLVDGIGDRLGDLGDQLRQVVPQLQMAFVEAKGRTGSSPS